jgi:serine protease inhibitor
MKHSLSAALGLALLSQLPGSAQLPAKLKGDPAAVVEGNNGFAADLYGQLAKEPGNLFFSPYSISNALAMTYGGARGNTAREMAAAMHFNLESGRFHAAFGELVRTLQGPAKDRQYQLKIANRLWGQKNFGFAPEFLKLSETRYLVHPGRIGIP